MYSGNYSAHIRNYGVLQNSFVLRASNFVPNKVADLRMWNFQKKKVCHIARKQLSNPLILDSSVLETLTLNLPAAVE
ncbi:hypothetical protein T12_1029 [Trichinella patagoniensis]|uniref:Uncharacterized protein n=1 Tax=Trichinella patagoniensis TaxID=990121 RepID=A0A0V1A0R1_9BILA|nr:hypothetical protein T12_8800 [Trichinella patagoniensis]KRY18152.1 hypothetical protein T12_14303 [Trichinella patagoniensis]KRY18164.1 hypothetical protein T12_4696 [Trichinella patagoniensis]KRY18181.1 hypothetical protein T12_1029 [Trichinella patagoniensis]